MPTSHDACVRYATGGTRAILEGAPEGEGETLTAINNPGDPDAGNRQVPFGRELWVEREDFMEDPPRKFYRLAPGREVRLRYAFFLTCREAIKDENGDVVELRCTYDPETRGGNAPDGRKVKATLHWVSAPTRWTRKFGCSRACSRNPTRSSRAREKPATGSKI